MISIKIDDKKLLSYLNRLKKDARELALQDAAEVILNANRDRNQRQVNPDGSKWAPLSELTKKTKKRKDRILYENGDLLRLIIDERRDSAVVGTPNKFAEYHQFGTDPYTIKPKNKKALAFGGTSKNRLVRKKVNHPGLPKQEILGLGPGDTEKITCTIRRHLKP